MNGSDLTPNGFVKEIVGNPADDDDAAEVEDVAAVGRSRGGGGLAGGTLGASLLEFAAAPLALETGVGLSGVAGADVGSEAETERANGLLILRALAGSSAGLPRLPADAAAAATAAVAAEEKYGMGFGAGAVGDDPLISMLVLLLPFTLRTGVAPLPPLALSFSFSFSLSFLEEGKKPQPDVDEEDGPGAGPGAANDVGESESSASSSEPNGSASIAAGARVRLG